MLPFFVLLVSTLLLRVIGMAGMSPFDSWTWCLRCGLALMFLFTASAHWGKRRGDLIAMVPRVFSRPDLMVSATGVCEILGGLDFHPRGRARRRGLPSDAADRAFPCEHTRGSRASDDWRQAGDGLATQGASAACVH